MIDNACLCKGVLSLLLGKFCSLLHCAIRFCDWPAADCSRVPLLIQLKDNSWIHLSKPPLRGRLWLFIFPSVWLWRSVVYTSMCHFFSLFINLELSSLDRVKPLDCWKTGYFVVTGILSQDWILLASGINLAGTVKPNSESVSHHYRLLILLSLKNWSKHFLI